MEPAVSGTSHVFKFWNIENICFHVVSWFRGPHLYLLKVVDAVVHVLSGADEMSVNVFCRDFEARGNSDMWSCLTCWFVRWRLVTVSVCLHAAVVWWNRASWDFQLFSPKEKSFEFTTSLFCTLVKLISFRFRKTFFTFTKFIRKWLWLEFFCFKWTTDNNNIRKQKFILI